MRVQHIVLLTLCSFIMNSSSVFASGPGKKHWLQIASDVYNKTVYIRLPSATIQQKVRNKILKRLASDVPSKWKAKITYLSGEWVRTLKFYPALNVGFYPTQNHNSRHNHKYLAPIGILLIYPKSFRIFLEDRLNENPPPIFYLGSNKRLVFYYYPKDQAKKRRALLQIIRSLLEIRT